MAVTLHVHQMRSDIIGFDLAEESHQMASIHNNHMFILLRSDLSLSASYLE